MAFTLKPPSGNAVTVEDESRKDVLVSRGWTLVEDGVDSDVEASVEDVTESEAPQPDRESTGSAQPKTKRQAAREKE